MHLVVSLLLFYKDGFGIEWPTLFDVSLNKEAKTIKTLNRTERIQVRMKFNYKAR